MSCWYAVQTKPRQEAVAQLHLRRQHFETYLPQIVLRKRRRDTWTKVVEPLFPRYLFIRTVPGEKNLAPVRSTRGVTGLVRFGDRLTPVPDSAIDYLRQTENPETHQHHAEDWPHRSGDAVRVLEGPFKGLTCVFQVATAEDRALLLIDLLGRQSTVSVAMATIAAAT